VSSFSCFQASSASPKQITNTRVSANSHEKAACRWQYSIPRLANSVEIKLLAIVSLRLRRIPEHHQRRVENILSGPSGRGFPPETKDVSVATFFW
jgi:hypothetical protein